MRTGLELDLNICCVQGDVGPNGEAGAIFTPWGRYRAREVGQRGLKQGCFQLFHSIVSVTHLFTLPYGLSLTACEGDILPSWHDIGTETLASQQPTHPVCIVLWNARHVSKIRRNAVSQS